MSFKPQFRAHNETEFCQNGQNFATKEEARKSALDRFNRWFGADEWRVVEVSDEEYPVNYKWDEEYGDVRLDK